MRPRDFYAPRAFRAALWEVGLVDVSAAAFVVDHSDPNPMVDVVSLCEQFPDHVEMICKAQWLVGEELIRLQRLQRHEPAATEVPWWPYPAPQHLERAVRQMMRGRHGSS